MCTSPLLHPEKVAKQIQLDGSRSGCATSNKLFGSRCRGVRSGDELTARPVGPVAPMRRGVEGVALAGRVGL